jgi:hypothetical protein
MSREAMKLALDMLNEIADDVYCDQKLEGVITALRQALETEQEPVLWLKTWSDGSVSVLKTKSHAFADHELEPLYAAPPKQWVGLTDEELKPLCDENPIMFGAYTVDFIQAIEAKLKEKNT